MNIIGIGKSDMSRFYARDTTIEVNLDAVANNIQQFRQHLAAGTQIMAVVKADAYGHGAIYVAKAALQAGANSLGVSFVDEGIELREAGITAPILILGYTPPEGVKIALEHDLTLTIFSEACLQEVSKIASQLKRPAKVHVKVDTGMGRIGLPPEQAVPFIKRATQLRNIHLEGVFTHYSTADEADQTYLLKQEECFCQVVEELRKENVHIPILHCSNSAAAIERPQKVYNMIRLGISLYGFYPSDEVNRKAVSLEPVLRLVSKVVQVKKPPKGTGISYGKTYVASGEEWIATVPIGYADGIDRHLSNTGYALVNGVRVPIVGRVCMDFLMLDVTNAYPVQVGDEVVFYGVQGTEAIHVDEVAKQLRTINYELVCRLGHRIPRIYRSHGKTIAVVNRLRQENVNTYR